MSQGVAVNNQVNQGKPTIRPSPDFSAEKDAEIIKEAMKGADTDEQAIIDVISQRSNQQRVEIAEMFKTMYDKDLIEDLESELSGDFRETIMAIFKPLAYYDAWSLHQAMSGEETEEAVLIEILCTRSNAEIKEINNCYEEYYESSLEKDIADDTGVYYKRFLVSCCQANRAENATVDLEKAKKEATALFNDGLEKMGTDESDFMQVIASRSYSQLSATYAEYVKVSQRDILNSIDREMTGDHKMGFRDIVMSSRNCSEYFAGKLFSALRGNGTKNSTLIRIVVSRSEIDLQDIKEEFLRKYERTLSRLVSANNSVGDYKPLLLALIGQ